MEKLKTSPAELLKKVPIQTIEQDELNRVFEYLSQQDKNKTENTDKIGAMDIAKTLLFLGCRPTKAEVELIIWEVDDDLDGFVSKQEFMTMYKRCISDHADLEPRKLFNLVQFLMYDKTLKGRVTVEETLQILYVRHGRVMLNHEIQAIFGEDDTSPDSSEERSITYGQYVERINQRALDKHFPDKETLKKRKAEEKKNKSNDDMF